MSVGEMSVGQMFGQRNVCRRNVLVPYAPSCSPVLTRNCDTQQCRSPLGILQRHAGLATAETGGDVSSFSSLVPHLDTMKQCELGAVGVPLHKYKCWYTLLVQPTIIDEAADLRTYIEDLFWSSKKCFYLFYASTPSSGKQHFLTNKRLVNSSML